MKFPKTEKYTYWNFDVIEANNQYYLLCDKIKSRNVGDEYTYREAAVIILNENLNIIKEVNLFSDSIYMPRKIFFINNMFYVFGNAYSKPFMAKFDENFNLLSPIFTYALNDTINYNYCEVINTHNNNFLCYYVQEEEDCYTRLSLIDTNNFILQDTVIPIKGRVGGLAEDNNYYYLQSRGFGQQNLIRVQKDAFHVYDYITQCDSLWSFVSLTDAMIIAANNNIIATGTIRMDCGFAETNNHRIIAFFDSTMQVKNKTVLGQPCVDDAGISWAADYITPDSVYGIYINCYYDSDNLLKSVNMHITNFSYDGNINFDREILLREVVNIPMFIYGSRATSDGGILFCGIIQEENGFCGYLIKYHPTKQDVGISISPLMEECLVYPNPAQSQITIANAENADIAIYNLLGQKILDKRNITKKETISVENLHNGIYLLQIQLGNIIVTRKIHIVH
ncbi:MAG: T9SS type A sorting domain-containing protein [Bacteroidales bacterium]|nr:T9SS type A sorting domain-containing protein [Bacteroidales bacterium]